MDITLQNAGKRYNREWIFRHLDFRFRADSSYAITGPNGSGKSTLLQLIAGALLPTEGSVVYNEPGTTIPVPPESYYRKIAISAPYLDLVEEMTALEQLKFHSSFKELVSDHSDILDRCGLKEASHKQIRYFSSGMKQRLKLALGFYSKCPILLLDEPSTNLDRQGIALYHSLLAETSAGKLVIISSNDMQEYQFCNHVLDISNYK